MKYPYLKWQWIFGFLRRFYFLSSITDNTVIGLDYMHMSNMAVSYKKQELLTLHEHLGSPPVFGWVRGAHLFSFLCCVFGVLFVFVLCLVFSQICRCLWIVYSWLSLCFSLTFIDHVPTIIYHMRPMLDILLNNELIFNTDRYNGSYLFCI